MGETCVSTVIERARIVAWMPLANLPGGPLYRERKAAHQRLIDALAALPSREAGLDELGYAIRAAWRVGAATFSNRYGEPYAERREAMLQLRGALDVLDRKGART